jgi:Mu-like prophage I protein
MKKTSPLASLYNKAVHFRSLFIAVIHAFVSELLYRRVMAVNSEKNGGNYEIICTNQVPVTGGQEWVLVAPWGVHSNEKGKQEITPELVAPLIEKFNQRKASMAANFRGPPIYDRHPTREEARAGLRPLGRIDGVRAGVEGLELKRVLNSDGIRNDQEGYLPYPSIGAYVKQLANGNITWVEIDHVAMCEHPNIRQVPAWTNSATEDKTTTNDNTMKLNEQLAALLGITATDDASLIAAVTALKTGKTESEAACNTLKQEKANTDLALNTMTAERDAAKKRADDADAKVVVLNKARVKDALDLAVNSGAITAAERPGWEARLETSNEAFAEYQAAGGESWRGRSARIGSQCRSRSNQHSGGECPLKAWRQYPPGLCRRAA